MLDLTALMLPTLATACQGTPVSDQKRWFKVWTSLLVDMDHRSAEEVGHWVRLGCRIALVGERGTVRFTSWNHVGSFFNVTVPRAHTLLNELPSLQIKDDGAVTVTMKNWVKYQEDSTQAARQRASRAKRRGEERKESTSESKREKSFEGVRTAPPPARARGNPQATPNQEFARAIKQTIERIETKNPELASGEGRVDP